MKPEGILGAGSTCEPPQGGYGVRLDRQLVISSGRLLRCIGVVVPAPIRGNPGLFSLTDQENDPYQADQGLD